MEIDLYGKGRNGEVGERESERGRQRKREGEREGIRQKEGDVMRNRD